MIARINKPLVASSTGRVRRWQTSRTDVSSVCLAIERSETLININLSLGSHRTPLTSSLNCHSRSNQAALIHVPRRPHRFHSIVLWPRRTFDKRKSLYHPTFDNSRSFFVQLFIYTKPLFPLHSTRSGNVTTLELKAKKTILSTGIDNIFFFSFQNSKPFIFHFAATFQTWLFLFFANCSGLLLLLLLQFHSAIIHRLLLVTAYVFIRDPALHRSAPGDLT